MLTIVREPAPPAPRDGRDDIRPGSHRLGGGLRVSELTTEEQRRLVEFFTWMRLPSDALGRGLGMLNPGLRIGMVRRVRRVLKLYASRRLAGGRHPLDPADRIILTGWLQKGQ